MIDQDDQQLGVMMLTDAIKKAEESGLDLVEVSPMAVPPVCRIMDYGKFKYEAKKKANESRKKQTVVEIKEVKVRPKTDEHDLDFKMKHISRFLEEGNKVKVTVMFRGREITHMEIGREMLKEIADHVKTVGQVEAVPKIEGKNMFMILSPLKKGQQPRPAGAPAASPAAGAMAAAVSSARPPMRASSAGPEIEVKQKRPAAPAAAVAKPDGAVEEKK